MLSRSRSSRSSLRPLLRTSLLSVGLALGIGACGDGSPSSSDTCESLYGTTTCGDYCADLYSDANNCGACAANCGGLFCSQGVCQESCAAGTTACSFSCCAAGQTCDAGGFCVSPPLGTGGNAGVGGTVGAGGTIGTGSTSGTGSTTSTGGVTGGPITPGQWNAFIPTGAANNLDAEYEKWWQANYRSCGSVGQGGSTVSEGIGYGMLITVGMGDQTRFDNINAFYHANLGSPAGLMDWNCGECGGCSDNAAMDADLDAAMALLMAAERWGGTYETQAVTLIQKLRGDKVVEVCHGRTVMRPGDADWAGCDSDPYYNPSYWTPAYYRAFAVADPAGAATWNALIDETYLGWDATLTGGHPDNLFIFPDGANATASGWVSSKGYSYNAYDACRVPWRIATDYAWTGDARAAALLQRVSDQVEASSMGAVAKTTNSAFYGSIALSGTAVDQATADAYFTEWMNATTAVQGYDDGPYFQGTLRMLYLLLAAGAFPSTLTAL